MCYLPRRLSFREKVGRSLSFPALASFAPFGQIAASTLLRTLTKRDKSEFLTLLDGRHSILGGFDRAVCVDPVCT